MCKLSTTLFIFLLVLILNEIRAQENTKSLRNKQLAASKCKEYTAPLNKNFELLPLVAGGKPQILKLPVCDQGGEQLIVGGQPARDGEFPHMAAIGYNNTEGGYSWLCGGSLISERYVLTAAHCLYHRSFGTALKVRLGSIYLEGNSRHLQEFDIVEVIRHPGYKHLRKYHDIGLFKLDRNVRISKDVRPACLYTDDTNDSSNVIAAGWGTMEAMGPTSDKLLKVGLHIYSNEVCDFRFRNTLKDGVRKEMLCAGYQPGGRDTCQGDSGGPLMVSQQYNQCIYYVIGVTSIGIGCGGQSSVYTRVSSYTDWIVENIW